MSEPAVSESSRGAMGAAVGGQTAHEWLCLLGQPQLADYLDLIRNKAIGGEASDPRTLTDEWRRANDYYGELEVSEAGIADEAGCLELDSSLRSLAAEVEADYRFRRAFDTLPTRLAMVELDRLIVYQRHVTRQFVDGLAAKLGLDPDPEALLRFCLPVDPDIAPVEVRRMGSRRFVFTSDSLDFRAHSASLLAADQISDFASFGPVAGVVAYAVGFGSNFLNAIQSDGRLVLHNGYHRACALRSLGIRYAPCIIQTVTRRDELNVAATSKVADEPAFYFRAARPPLLKDFFDPRIRKVVAMRRIKRVIEVKLEVQEHTVAE